MINIISHPNFTSDFYIFKEGIIFKEGKSIKYLNKISQTLLNFNENFVFKVFDDRIFTRTKKEVSFFTPEIALDWKHQFDGNNSRNAIILNINTIIINELKADNWISSLITREKQIELEHHFSMHNIHILSANRYAEVDSSLKIFESETGNSLWQISLEDLLNAKNVEIFGNVISLLDKLFFYCTDHPKQIARSSFCLDETTGDLIKALPNFTGSIKQSSDLLYTTHNNQIQVLDPRTYEVNTYDLSNEMKKNNLKRMDLALWTVIDNKLIFAQNTGDIVAKIAVLDLNTLKIIDKLELQKRNGLIGNLIVNRNRLYVHTQDRTLHVYDLGESPT